MTKEEFVSKMMIKNNEKRMSLTKSMMDFSRHNKTDLLMDDYMEVEEVELVEDDSLNTFDEREDYSGLKELLSLDERDSDYENPVHDETTNH
jgi:hypothetical protein